MPGFPALQPTLYPQTIVVLPGPSYTAGNTVVFDTTGLTYGALDITLTSFTGGTAPSATFTLQRQGADGVWYTVWTSGATNSPTVWSIDIGPNTTQQTTGNANAPAAAVHAVFTAQGRFSYSFAGSPTSVAFTASLIGR